MILFQKIKSQPLNVKLQCNTVGKKCMQSAIVKPMADCKKKWIWAEWVTDERLTS